MQVRDADDLRREFLKALANQAEGLEFLGIENHTFKFRGVVVFGVHKWQVLVEFIYATGDEYDVRHVIISIDPPGLVALEVKTSDKRFMRKFVLKRKTEFMAVELMG